MEKISEVGGHGSGSKEYDKWAPTVSSGDSWKYPDPNVGPHPVKTALYCVGIYGLQS